MPGLEIVLDTHSKLKHGKRFTQLLVDNPSVAYKLLVEVLGGSKTSATLVLQYLLQPLAEEPGLVEEALKKLEQGEDKLVKKIILAAT